MADLHPDNPYSISQPQPGSETVAFSPAARKRFDLLLERYPTKMAALLPTLHLAQEEWGWISPAVVHYVGDLLDLAPATVFGVVTFYNMYNQKPVGKHYLQVCTNLSCMLMNAYDIYDSLSEKLGVAPGGTSRDGKFTLTEVECLGSCGTAPVVQINNDYHENMNVEKMNALLTTLK